jgi:hypothetical protein
VKNIDRLYVLEYAIGEKSGRVCVCDQFILAFRHRNSTCTSHFADAFRPGRANDTCEVKLNKIKEI